MDPENNTEISLNLTSRRCNFTSRHPSYSMGFGDKIDSVLDSNWTTVNKYINTWQRREHNDCADSCLCMLVSILPSAQPNQEVQSFLVVPATQEHHLLKEDPVQKCADSGKKNRQMGQKSGQTMFFFLHTCHISWATTHRHFVRRR